MRKKYFLLIYFIIGIWMMNACGSEPWKPSSQFQMTVHLTNPVKAKRMTLGVRVHPHTGDCYQMFIQRRAGRFSELDYMENGLVRRNPADTVCLSRNERIRLMKFLGLASPELPVEQIPAADEDFYSITVEDSTQNLRIKTFYSSDNANGRLARYVWDLFTRYYPETPVRHSDAEMRMIRHASVNDTMLIQKINDDIVLEKNRQKVLLDENTYLRLWTILESNGVWALKTDTTYKLFSPYYSLKIRLGLYSTAWEVAAPHLLADKRYDAIVHAIERAAE